MLSGDVSVPVWVGLVLVVLAPVGVYAAACAAGDGAAAVWEWLRRNRVSALIEDDDPGELCPGCLDDSDHCDGANAGCDCTCGWDEDWAERELPSREELGFTGPLITLPRLGTPIDPLRAEQERRAPWWEAEHRAAYESLDLEYPTGLIARVRELAR